MLLPVGDTPNPPGIPYVTYLLIGLNVAVFLLMAAEVCEAWYLHHRRRRLRRAARVVA